MVRFWTDAEVDFLRLAYCETPNRQLSEILGRTVKAVSMKAEGLGLVTSGKEGFVASMRQRREVLQNPVAPKLKVSTGNLQVWVGMAWRYVAGINSIEVEGQPREILTTRSKKLALPESMAWDAFHEMSERFPSREFRVAKSLRNTKRTTAESGATRSQRRVAV